MYEIDFLPVRGTPDNGPTNAGTITMRLTVESESREAIVVIDAGHIGAGQDIVDHVRKYYDSSRVDLVIATRPDAEHLAGLAFVLNELDVVELLVHQPLLHVSDVSDRADLDALDHVLAVARDTRTRITEPFTGTFRLDGQVTILGPPQSYYEQFLQRIAADHPRGSGAVNGTRLLGRSFRRFRIEALTGGGDQRHSGKVSVVILVQVADHRLLFTGDAEGATLEHAVDFYESWFGDFAAAPIHFLQAPPHGSLKGMRASSLNRILGRPGAPHNSSCVAFISGPGGDKHHPAPKLVNALSRRGCLVRATEGRAACHSFDGPPRPDWMALPPARPLEGRARSQQGTSSRRRDTLDVDD